MQPPPAHRALPPACQATREPRWPLVDHRSAPKLALRAFFAACVRRANRGSDSLDSAKELIVTTEYILMYTVQTKFEARQPTRAARVVTVACSAKSTSICSAYGVSPHNILQRDRLRLRCSERTMEERIECSHAAEREWWPSSGRIGG